MDIDLLEPVRLGESTQWIRIRAASAGNPLLLLVQQGPGLPMINEVRTFERVLSLEDDFTVVYWDQRGCGRSLRSAGATRDLSIETMVSDTERLLAMLCDRFDRPAVVAGFSMGAMIAARAAARRPDLVATLVAVSMDIDGGAAGKNAYEFALAAARARQNRRAVRQLAAIGPPPHLTPEGFATRGRWAINFGGVRIGQTYNSMARGPGHPGDHGDDSRGAAGAGGTRPDGRAPPPGLPRRHGPGPARSGRTRLRRGALRRGADRTEQAVRVV